ncbi:MAG TPA: hypothetical protein VKR53_02280 [Puia sp.]|nr:hypothetical protein [Puia sp.]
MRKLFLLAFWILSIALVHATDRSSPASIEDLILHETQEIQEAEICGAADLSLKYINRAESYIVAGKFEKALEDLEKGHEVAWLLSQKNIEQRTLVDRMVVYAYLGDDEKALSAVEHFKNLFYSSEDHNFKKGCLCQDENYVSGPDNEPAPGWCQQVVNSTANDLIKLVERSPLGRNTKDSIIVEVDSVRSSGLQCCARGERWKGCVGPLAKKLLEWQASGVPKYPQWN